MPVRKAHRRHAKIPTIHRMRLRRGLPCLVQVRIVVIGTSTVCVEQTVLGEKPVLMAKAFSPV